MLTALAIELVGTIISVKGLTTLFSGSLLIVAIAISLDAAKIAVVSYVQQYWNSLSVGFKTYMLSAVIVLTLITSGGTFSFLTGEFQNASISAKQVNSQLEFVQAEFDKKTSRKNEIDRQMSAIPDTDIVGRRRLLNMYGEERNALISQLTILEQQLPKLKQESLSKNNEIGPINFISELAQTSHEKASFWIVASIIFVFDPLALALLAAANKLFSDSPGSPQLNLKKDDEVVNTARIEAPQEPSIDKKVFVDSGYELKCPELALLDPEPKVKVRKKPGPKPGTKRKPKEKTNEENLG